MQEEVKLTKTKIYNIDYHVTDRCNQNCASCGHFCPLVPKDTEHKSLEQVKKDLTLLSKHSNAFVNLTLTGGECTLHPQLIDIMDIARELFPNQVISLYTNGTTAATFEKYKETLDKNNIHVEMSWYPNIKNGVDEIYQKVGDNFEHKPFVEYFYKGFFSSNEVASDYEIFHCGARGVCCQLVDGKLYACQYAAYFPYFDNYFKGQHNLKLNGNEYIDLTTDVSDTDIVRFVYNANFDLCKHCLDAKRCCGTYENSAPWKHSDKLIDEWYNDYE